MELLDYDRATGVLTWRVRRSGTANAGTVAGKRKKNGQIEVRIDGVAYQAHRVAWKIHTGKEPPAFLDHWDRNPSNNSLANLREADRYQNSSNGSRYKNNVSGFRGVSPVYSRGRAQPRRITSWQAQITHRGRQIYLGEYKNREQAHAVYLYHAMIYHGFFASDGEDHPAGGRFGFIRFMLAHLLGPDEKGEERHA